MRQPKAHERTSESTVSHVLRDALLLVLPPFGAALLALAARHDDLYRFLVREDSLLEWTQVVTYLSVIALAIVAAPRLSRAEDRASAVVVIGLAVVALVSAGEELSWGQRLFDFTTPDLLADNRQGESTLHNDAKLEVPTRVALLMAGLYGTVAPLVIRRLTPFVPPRTVITLFAVVATYFGIRLLFLTHPTYVEAKYSEWAEFCFAAGIAWWCAERSRVMVEKPKTRSAQTSA